MLNSTIDQAEIKKFEQMAASWWDPKGPFKPLHQINPIRLEYIKRQVLAHYDIKDMWKHALSGLRVLDIGCGGGLISEPLARQGCIVTGIDASEKNINIASTHAKTSELEIEYINTTAEELSSSLRQFDIVLALEIVEHVADINLFIRSCTHLLKPGGIMILSTINRNLKSYLFAIIGAEYVLRWLPRGTHDWNKFITPMELENYLLNNKLATKDKIGMSYNPLANTWSLGSDLSVNYIMCAVS
jgi:2-polyprenyl-6-hydroxyphenyl methylase/3-demethylubiquinone-9 3-methyltransferase